MGESGDKHEGRPDPSRIVLASRSPRRRDLLELIVEASRIEVLPPPSAEEPSLAQSRSLEEVSTGLAQIAAMKADSVPRLIKDQGATGSCVLAADTTVVATDSDGKLRVLEKPPEHADWKRVVAGWFHDLYAGRTHLVMSGVAVRLIDGRKDDFIVQTRVTMISDVERHLERYLASGEPLGKAGGYAIQETGSVFVEKVEGSLTNVIGLPVREVSASLDRLGFDLGHLVE